MNHVGNREQRGMEAIDENYQGKLSIRSTDNTLSYHQSILTDTQWYAYNIFGDQCENKERSNNYEIFKVIIEKINLAGEK